ncbi:MAG: PAS domain S-box protein [Thermoleophilia bacterium]
MRSSELKVEKSLWSNDESFRVIFENANDGFLIASTSDRKFVEANKNMCRMLGCTLDEIKTLGVEDIHPKQDLPRVIEAFEQQVRGELSVAEALPVLRKDGSVFHADISSTQIILEGRPYALGIFRDITARLQTQVELRRSEELFRSLFENAPIGLGVVGLDDRLQRVNPALCDFLGYTEDELLARTVSEITHPDDRQLEASNKSAILDEGQKSFQMEKRYLHADGRIVWGQLSVSPLRDDEGNITYFLGQLEDINARKQAEDELKESETQFRMLFDQSTDAIFILDLQGNFIDVNQTGHKRLGYAKEEMLAMCVSELDPPEFAAMEPERFEMLRREGHAIFESAHIRKDGSVMPVEINARIIDFRGQAVLFSVIRDITERQVAEQEKEKLQAQLMQAGKMEAVGRLAGGVAHDFNNMLGAILGNAELAMMETREEDPIYDNLQEITQAARRSADLTRQLLAFARKQSISVQVMDLNARVTGMLKMVERLVGEDIRLSWKPGPDLPLVRMDPTQVDQLLINLAVNARDAIDGVGIIAIETEPVVLDEAFCRGHIGSVPGDYAELEVSDDGRGMGKEVLDQLFQPFFTTKEMGQGTGLGLAMVYGIVKQNAGFISVYSEPGEGTTFRIYLPAARGEAETGLQGEPERSAGGTETILIVEDDRAILDIATRVLEESGYTVLAAATPGEAIDLVTGHAGLVHLLITDVIMPGMNGKDLRDQVKARLPDIKVLFMSGYTADVISQRGVLDEDIDFLQKPFSISSLKEMVREVLDRE